MTEYQITSWRALPSLVVARADGQVTKVSLPSRFQEAIDEAAMRLGETGADAYLAGWERGPWTPSEGDPAAVAAQVATDLEERWDEDAVSRFLASLGPAAEDASAHG